jgi:hypothetical protein
MVSVFYLPLFAYSLALDFDQLDAMCGEGATDGSENIDADGTLSAWWSVNFCSDKMYYEAVGTVCIFLQVRCGNSACASTAPWPEEYPNKCVCVNCRTLW